jgi:penicillin amidase
MPSAYDPPQGWIVTANQAPVPKHYPYYLGDSWDYGYRSQRILDLVRRTPRLSVDDMRHIQLDVRNGFAPTLVPYLLHVDLGTVYYSGGQRLLRHWDDEETVDSSAAAYYNAVWHYLLELTFRDQIPASVKIDGGDRWFEVMRRLLREPRNKWWDDVDTEGVRETRDDIIVEAMKDARDQLVELQSRRPADWTWGHQHTLTLENQTVGQSHIGLVRSLLNRGPWQLPGGTDLVDATGWNASKGYQVNWVPSMRMVVSMANLDDSTWINLTGASGHAFDSHYTDQTDLWARGQTRPWAFTPAAVRASTQDTLTLEPGTS